jgi:superfamily I DNA/RNA helicase
MPWDQNLQGPAYDIASSNDARLRVLAGPGTGKTFALNRLVMRLLEQGENPRRILVVTFTRTAAADLERELERLDVPGCDEISVGTLHSYCFTVLARAAVLAQHNRVARIVLQVKKQGGYLGFEYGPLLKDLNNSEVFGDTRSRIRRIRAYEAAWARQQREVAGQAQDPVDQQFEAALLSWLRFHRAMLIGELIPEALTYLRENPLAQEHSAFDRVIVDEYQDLNKADQSIIDVLAARGNLMIVGDEDQSIYHFRHANPEGIEDFPNRHPGTVDRTMDTCRRCAKAIVRAANSLISYNHLGGGAVRPLHEYAQNPEGEIHRVQWASLNQEILGLADYVQCLIQQGRYEAKDFLILCPRRRIGYRLRRELRDRNIDARSFFPEEALEEKEAQEAFALLILLADPDDRVAFRFWLGCKSGSWLAGQYARLRASCENSGDSPYQALSKMESGEIPRVGYSHLLVRFRALQTQLRALEGKAGSELVDAIYPSDTPWAEAVRDILAGQEITEETDAGQLLTMVREKLSRPEIPSNPAYVRIMSLHASKGLTSKVTIISTIVNSLIPNEDPFATPAEQQRNMEEQRRLFYVGVTRTREVLVLSYPVRLGTPDVILQLGAHVAPGGQTVPSTFLRELGLQGNARAGDEWAASGYG